MAVTAADIKAYLTGGGANTDPNLSLGGATSATEINAASLNNLFNYVSEVEAAAGSVKYRAFIIKNTSASTWYGVMAWLSGVTVSANSSIAIVLDDGAAQAIADEDTAPVGLAAFSAPATKDTGLSLGDMVAGAEIMVWVQRTVTAGAAICADDIDLAFEGGNAP